MIDINGWDAAESTIFRIEDSAFVHFVRHYNGWSAVCSLSEDVKLVENRVIKDYVGPAEKLTMEEIAAAEIHYGFTANFAVGKRISFSKK